MARKTEHLTVGRRRITVSNLDKILYPGTKFSKARVIDYYIGISKYLLPHFKDRPVTLKRFPDGVFGESFYEKDAPAFTPEWVKTVSVPRRETPGPDIRYILLNDLPTLVWVANLATLELHPFLHRAQRLDRPTSIVFDCDPGEGADILQCVRVALMLRDVLQELGFDSYVKVSGSKGLQVYVPLNSDVTYDQTQPLAQGIAQLLAQREPKLIVWQMPKRLRAKKVFIDWSQNDDYKTTVGVYSLRAKTYRPYVSVPVEWNELSEALQTKDAESLFFTPEETLNVSRKSATCSNLCSRRCKSCRLRCGVTSNSNNVRSRRNEMNLSRRMKQNEISGKRLSRSPARAAVVDRAAGAGLLFRNMPRVICITTFVSKCTTF